jgi:methyl-accepting chemotaxis protein
MKDREFTVILEDIKSNFRVFGEKLQSMDEKFDTVSEQVAKNTEGIVEINQKLDHVSERTDKNAEDTSEIKQNIISKKDHRFLEKRITLLEKKVSQA